MWRQFTKHGTFSSPLKRGRKKLDPETCYTGRNLGSEHITALQEYVIEMNKGGEGTTIKALRMKLLENFNIKVRNALIRKVLMRLGF